MRRAGSCPRGPPRRTSARRHLQILGRSTWTAIGSLARGRQSVFAEHALAGPRTRRVHPGAACLAARIPSRNRPHLVPPKTEQSTLVHATPLGEVLSPRVHWPDWPARRETRHWQFWDPLL